jgi:uncharacterized protein (DUF1330 family)
VSAYVIVDISVSNPERYQDYKTMAAESVARYDGRYLVRGGHCENLEGAWDPQRVVVLEFPTYEAAKAWWASDDYRDAKALRQAVSESRMIVVEGV